MRKEILIIGIILVFIAAGLSGCLNESTVTSLAKQMEDSYTSLSTYRTIVNYTTQSGYSEQYIKTVKRPDKLKYEYVFPERKQGDMRIINGYTEWDYDKSGNRAFEATCSINIGEERLDSPDFLNMLLFLMDNADIEILDDEKIDGINTTVLQINFNAGTSLYRWKFWLNKETLFPIKFEVLDPDGTVRYSESFINSETNVDISDSEFLLPEETEIISIGEMKLPETLEECENFTGWKILFPSYLPEGHSLNEEYFVGSGSILLSGDGTYETNYFQNSVWTQIHGSVDTVRITYPHIDSYAEIIDLTTGEILDTVNTSTGQFPSEWFGNIEFETYTNDITLQEAVEDIWGEEYGPKTNVTKVDINGSVGEYWDLHLSWNLDEYWLILTVDNSSDIIETTIDLDELINIAESIQK